MECWPLTGRFLISAGHAGFQLEHDFKNKMVELSISNIGASSEIMGCSERILGFRLQKNGSNERVQGARCRFFERGAVLAIYVEIGAIGGNQKSSIV